MRILERDGVEYRAEMNPAFLRAVQQQREERAREAELRARIAALELAVEREKEIAAKAAAEAERRQEVMAKAVDSAQREVKQILRQTTYRRVEQIAVRLFGISRAELHSNRRLRRLCFARQFVMYWAARRTRLSLPQLGRLLGGRDHTTILHGKRAYVEKRKAQGRTLRPV